MGWRVERLTSWRAPLQLRDHQIVLYGEPLFAAVVADTLGLAVLEPPFSWLADTPYEYRLRDIECTDLAKARRQVQRAFMKPADDKCFAARVYDSGQELPSTEILADSTPVLISEPVIWEVEFRCFVMDRRVSTHSVYARHGDIAQAGADDWPAPQDEMSAALAFAETVVQDDRIGLPPSVVIDVGVISNRGWAVVEANASWASGIYGCDPRKVLQVLSGAVKRTEDLSDEDRHWIVVREN
jgi:hypothetical protein